MRNARLVLASVILAAVLPSSAAHAVTQVFAGSAENMTIFVGDSGKLQAVLPGSTHGLFYGTTTQPGAARFVLRVKSGANAGTTYSSTSGYTALSNGPVTGDFTLQSPARNVTTWAMGPVARVTQTTLYVGSQNRFNVIYEVQNVSGAPLQFIAGVDAIIEEGADSQFNGILGSGVFIDGPRRFIGVSSAESAKISGLQEVTLSRRPEEAAEVPIAPWASYGQGEDQEIYGRLQINDAFNNLIDPAPLLSPAVGASWDDHAATGNALPSGGTARYEVQWVADQLVPFTAFPALDSKELPYRPHEVALTLRNAEGSPLPGLPVRYRVNGVNAFPANPAEYRRGVTNDAGQVIVSWSGTTPGVDTVLAFADIMGAENGVRDASEPEASARMTWIADNHVDGRPTGASILTGPTGKMHVGSIDDPDNSDRRIFTFGRAASASAGFDPCTINGQQGRRMNFPLSVNLQPGNGTIDSAELLAVDRAAQDPNATSGPTAPPAIPATSSTGNTRSFVVECVTNTDLWVRFKITEGADTQTFVIPIGGLLLVDPQGVVYDRAAYDAARAGGSSAAAARAAAAIPGATVRLQRRNSNGAFVNLLSGDPGIRPNVNPQTTAADGVFQWDVQGGTYRVAVSADGFVPYVSRSVIVPPPVLDLDIPLERPAGLAPALPGAVAKPAANATPAATRSTVVLKLPKRGRATVRLSKNGVLVLGSVSCPKSAASCTPATVTLKRVARRKGRDKLPAILATRTFGLQPGQTSQLRLKLSKRLTRQILARRSVAVVATVVGSVVPTKSGVFLLR